MDMEVDVVTIEQIKAGYIASLDLVAKVSEENKELRWRNAFLQSEIESLTKKNAELAGTTPTKKSLWARMWD